jgi:hypothetical protein
MVIKCLVENGGEFIGHVNIFVCKRWIFVGFIENAQVEAQECYGYRS